MSKVSSLPSEKGQGGHKTTNSLSQKPNLSVDTVNQYSLDKSKLKMNSITSNPRNAGISEFQSSFTLQHSTPSISFTKASRFPELLKMDSSVLDQADIKHPFKNPYNKISFGYGQKTSMPVHIIKNAMATPSPADFNLSKATIFGSDFKNLGGKTFGVHKEFFKKVYNPEVIEGTFVPKYDIPGVGEYNIQINTGKAIRSSTIGARARMFNEKEALETPACNHYNANYKLIYNTRYSNRSFGSSKRSDFTRLLGESPSPNSYTLPSIFDKFRKSSFPSLSPPKKYKKEADKSERLEE